jgi:hypothetical protein
MIAHKKGFNPLLHSAEGGAQPSPPSHIKAVFGTTQDKEFYGPMAGGRGGCKGCSAMQCVVIQRFMHTCWLASFMAFHMWPSSELLEWGI